MSWLRNIIIHWLGIDSLVVRGETVPAHLITGRLNGGQIGIGAITTHHLGIAVVTEQNIAFGAVGHTRLESGLSERIKAGQSRA